MSHQPAPRKSLGQHWLNDDNALRMICDAASLQSTDTVLEIGPGPGALTAHLLKVAQQVVAVELDETLAEQLAIKFKGRKLRIVKSDILTFNFSEMPHVYKLVANIPYYLTGKLLRQISETGNPPRCAVLLVQKEVAERIAAQPGQLSIVAVITQFYWRVSLGHVVPAELFTPAPKVDSQVLILQRRDEPLFTDVDAKTFFQLVKAGFAQPRKTILNNLSAGLHFDRLHVEAICQAAKIDSSRRPQSFSLGEWHNLYRAVSNQ